MAKDWLFVDAGKKVPLAPRLVRRVRAARRGRGRALGLAVPGTEGCASSKNNSPSTMGARHAIAVSNGSIALLVSLQAMGVAPGDEVIAPNMTFISSATAAMVLGARPVLCDINLTNYCIDVDRLESLITPRTKVIVPVHYAGQTADMEPHPGFGQSARPADPRRRRRGAPGPLSRRQIRRHDGKDGNLQLYAHQADDHRRRRHDRHRRRCTWPSSAA